MTDPILLRGQVRFILSSAPKGRYVSEDVIHAKLKADFPEVRVSETRVAIEWNHAKGLVTFTRNEEQERDEWMLTDAGREKEGLK